MGSRIRLYHAKANQGQKSETLLIRTKAIKLWSYNYSKDEQS